MKRHHAVILALAIGSALAARTIAWLAFRDVAHVMDEITYVLQAKIFATGHVTAPVAEPRGAFNMYFVEDRHARFGIFPPGWPAILAVALKAGLERWLNPALHAVTVVLVGRAGERLGGPRLAMLAALAYAVSPQSVILAASLMSHTVVALAAATIMLLLVSFMRKEHASTWLVAASGLGLGVVASTRPLCAVLLAFALALGVLVYARGREARIDRVALGLALGAAPFVLGLLAFNHATTGSALRFPQMAYFDEHIPPANVPFFKYRKGCNELGFGAARGCDLTAENAQHSISNALTNLRFNLTSWLLLVAGPLLPAGAALALARKETRGRAAFLVAIPLGAFALYSLYWHGGTCLGARFYHAALPAAVLLIAMGIDLRDRRFMLGFVGALLAWDALAYNFVLREIGDRQWGYWAVDDRFAVMRRNWREGKSVVMIAFGGDDAHNPDVSWTATLPTGGMWMLNIRAHGALGENEAFVDQGEIVFAKFHPRLVDAITKRFPDRKLFLYVMRADRTRDELTPWNPARFDPAAFEVPPDNFDGFRVEPVELPTPWLFVPGGQPPP